jgi:hypothetical protein
MKPPKIIHFKNPISTRQNYRLKRKRATNKTMEEINNNKIIELIKESNVIIIYGGVGRGRKLLFTKLSQHPKLAGIIYRGGFKLSDLSTTGNIYIDDLNLVSNFSPSSNPLEIKEQLKQWQELLSTARKRQQRIFLTVNEDL